MTTFGETVTNEAGGKQSRIETRLDLMPAQVVYEVGKVLAAGAAKYGEYNWVLIPPREHIAHALEHINTEVLMMEDEHVSDATDALHAICRLMFAAHLILNGQTGVQE